MSANLRGRVREQREKTEQHTGNGNSAVERRPGQPATIAQFIEVMKGEMARALPRHMSAERLARIALTEVRRAPKLALCTQQSFGGALMTCAQLGLEPGVTGEAYLIPRKNKYLSRQAGHDVFEVQLTIGYQGMVKLYWQSPLAKSLDAQTVHENDDFEYEYGLTPRLRHRPSLTHRGPVIAYYAVATLANGGSAFVVLSPADVEKFRERSSSKDDGPWVTDYDAMARKTCVRQLFKLLPRSPELAQAMAQDEAVRTDWSEDAIDMQPQYADAVAGEVEKDETPAAAQQKPSQESAAGDAGAAAEELPVEDPPDADWPAATQPGTGGAR